MSEWKIETFANPAEETAIYTGEAGSYVNIGSVMGKDTAQRVVECVNALEGVEDPAAELAALRADREELHRLRDACRSIGLPA